MDDDEVESERFVRFPTHPPLAIVFGVGLCLGLIIALLLCSPH